jgi:4'-phosphopantetheinyl transferase
MVVVHRVSLSLRDAERSRFEALLPDDERRRAERFRCGIDGDRFVAARARLRLLLSGYGAGPAARIRFGYGAQGKPLLPSQPDLRFNLSHSGECALVAVALHHEVGVDVELLGGDRRLDGVAERFFSRAENEALARRHARERTIACHRCWCRKEAYVKARGEGLMVALDSFDVAVDHAGAGATSLLLATRPNTADALAWDLRDLDVGPGYVAALAIEGRIARVRYVVHPEGVDLDHGRAYCAIRSM